MACRLRFSSRRPLQNQPLWSKQGLTGAGACRAAAAGLPPLGTFPTADHSACSKLPTLPHYQVPTYLPNKVLNNLPTCRSSHEIHFKPDLGHHKRGRPSDRPAGKTDRTLLSSPCGQGALSFPSPRRDSCTPPRHHRAALLSTAAGPAPSCCGCHVSAGRGKVDKRRHRAGGPIALRFGPGPLNFVVGNDGFTLAKQNRFPPLTSGTRRPTWCR